MRYGISSVDRYSVDVVSIEKLKNILDTAKINYEIKDTGEMKE